MESGPITLNGIKSISEVKHTCSSLAGSLPASAANLLVLSKAGALPAFIPQNILEGREFSQAALSTQQGISYRVKKVSLSCRIFKDPQDSLPYLFSWPSRMRFGAVPVSVAVPPMLAAYGIEMRKPFHMFVLYSSSFFKSETASLESSFSSARSLL